MVWWLGSRSFDPVAALEVFEAIKRENLGKRGRPKGSGGGARRPGRPAGSARTATGGGRGGGRSAAGGAKAEGGGDLLTLTEIGQRTGISYPTLRNYAERHGDRIPAIGEGRMRRYRPEAVAVFREIRAGSRPGRKPGGAAAAAGEGKRGGAARPDGGAPAARAATDGAGSVELAKRVAELAGRQERLERELARLHESLTRPVEATLRWQ